MKRRDFIKCSLQSAAMVACVVRFPLAAANTRSEQIKLSALSAFIDTLIPADITPSASQLGLEAELINYAYTVKDYIRLLELGCKWLDFQARSSRKVDFNSLSDNFRARLVGQAENSVQGSIPQQFFNHVRADLFKLYYSHPLIWPSLGLNGAPQPLGHLDYVLAPKVRKYEK